MHVAVWKQIVDRVKIVKDGPGRWLLVDGLTNEETRVFATKIAAEMARQTLFGPGSRERRPLETHVSLSGTGRPPRGKSTDSKLRYIACDPRFGGYNVFQGSCCKETFVGTVRWNGDIWSGINGRGQVVAGYRNRRQAALALLALQVER